MSRRHQKSRNNPPPAPESLYRSFTFRLTPDMHGFLVVEAKRLSQKTGKKTTPQDVVRALIAAYYEKRMTGLLVSPDD